MIGNIAKALARAQGQIRGALKDSSNPFFKSTYADLASVWEACRKPLSDNELAVVQPIDMIDGSMYLKTILMHSSGETIEGRMIMQLSDKATAQQVGSLITYYRRYGLAAMVGVAPEDDDGNAASETHVKTKSPAQKWAESDPSTLEPDVKIIAAAVDEAKTIEALDDVIHINAQFVGDLKEKQPKWHAALMTKMDAKRLSLTKGK